MDTSLPPHCLKSVQVVYQADTPWGPMAWSETSGPELDLEFNYNCMHIPTKQVYQKKIWVQVLRDGRLLVETWNREGGVSWKYWQP